MEAGFIYHYGYFSPITIIPLKTLFFILSFILLFLYDIHVGVLFITLRIIDNTEIE
jgi:hypothetical protein